MIASSYNFSFIEAWAFRTLVKIASKEEESRFLIKSNFDCRSLSKLFSSNALKSLYNFRFGGAVNIFNFKLTAVNL